MPGSEMVYQFGAMQVASDDINSAISTMNNELSELESRIAPLVSTWEGSAKDTYAQRQSEWRSASQELAQVLTQIKGAVIQSTADMQGREQTNTGLFGG
jgi:early secretory antigenic target protein ESAT-6